ncbi:MAG: NAD-binding protein, partial [Acidimicrobiales bacterium]
EREPEQARELSRRLPGVTVVMGDITDTQLLIEEDVGRMDAVVAATGEDAANVLACALAQSEGTAFTVVVLHRLELLPLVRQFGINAAISPRTASANSILRLVRGDVSVSTFLESNIEVDEIQVQAESEVCGVEVKDIHFSHDILLGAVIRGDGSSEIVRGSTRLAASDHVVLFAQPNALQKARGAFTARP